MTSHYDIRAWGEMIKFSHTVFAMPFALMAVFLAARNLPGRLPSAAQFILIILCMVAARSYAMTFNRIADADIDARNPRTRERHIPAGRISRDEAWRFLYICAAAFAVACAGFLFFCENPWPLLLSAPTLALLAAYSYAKRVTYLAHYVLGAAIAFAPTAAWIAIHPASIGWTALALSGVVLFWIAGFDIIYACQDVDIDRRDGLFSTPARFGVARALLWSRTSHVLAVAMLIAVGLLAGLGMLYWAAVALTALLLIVEQWIVRPDDLSKINLAFFTLNGVVSLVLGAAAIIDMIWISGS